MKALDNAFWVISSYFNPMGSNRRLQNYRVFRRALKAPLATVEWVWTKRQMAQLNNEDADILKTIVGPDLLWQKERMLNEAVRILPRDCKYVAWLDCDILFDNPEWTHQVVEALQSYDIVQPYSICINLSPDGRPIEPDKLGGKPKHTLANPETRKSLSQNALRHELRGLGVGCGHAWAARVELLRKHGLYDACILGSGDRAIFSAALGRAEDASSYMRMNLCRTEHYLGWAMPFHKTVQGRVGWISGRIDHLWHGSIIDRRYEQRHIEFAAYGFVPTKHLTIDKSGSWRWRNQDSPMATYVEQYFRQRNEDGDYLKTLSDGGSTEIGK